MKTISVITKTQVGLTFNSEPCLLRRTISKLVKVNGIRRYTIVTDYCNFVETQIPITEQVEVLDVDGNPTDTFETQPVLDVDGNPTFDIQTNLVSLGLAKETNPSYNSDIADAMFEQIRPVIDFNASFTEFMTVVEQYSLLSGTQIDLPLGTKAEDWEIYNAE